MKKLLKELLDELGKNINDREMAFNEKSRYIFEKIAEKSRFDGDPLEILFEEFKENGYSVLSTFGRDKAYESHGEYLIFPFIDSNGKSNKYNDEDISKLFNMDGDFIPKEGFSYDEKLGYIDSDGDKVFDNPNPEDYDVVLINYLLS